MIYLKRNDEAFEISDSIYRLTSRRIDEGDGLFFDVSGYMLFPAFVDTHTHLIGRFMLDLDVSGRKDKRSIIEAIERVEREKIIVYGRDETLLGEPILPEDLDHIERPVLAIRIDGHVGVANKALAEQFGLASRYLYEDELYRVLQRLKDPSRREEAIRKALAELARRGVLRVGEISKDPETIRLASEMGFPAEFLLELLDDIERLEGVKRLKVYADGSLGAHTAALRDPYRDDPGNYGRLLLTSDEVAELARKAESLGLGLAVHAIGDRAIDEVLDGLSRVDSPRHRIEHFELVREEHLELAARLGVRISVQPNFVHNRGRPGGLYEKRLGPERLMRVMPLDEMLAYGLRFAFGSDCMPFDPIIGLKGAVEHPFHPIDLRSAVRLYTLRAAEMLGFEYPRPSVVAIDGRHESVLSIYRNERFGKLKPERRVIVGAKRELSPEEFIGLVTSKISL